MKTTQIRDDAFILARVAFKENGCWEWLRRPHPQTGYGQTTRADQSTVGVHVLSHEIFKGPAGDGMVVDHTCSNRICCNPAHLEAVTQQENARRTADRRRNANSRKDNCPKCGGPYETTVTASRPRGYRWCRPCHRVHQNNYARARRATRKE